MQINQSHLEIHITGDGAIPGNVRAKDLAEILGAMEEMLADYVVRNNPEVKLDDVYLGLKKIEHGSIGLLFIPTVPHLIYPAWQEISSSIENGTVSQLPKKTRECIGRLRKVVSKRNYNAEVSVKNGGEEHRADINSGLEIPDAQPLRGETTIYGQIVRVGGKEPKVVVEMIDNSLIYCKAINTRIVKEAGTRLYTEAGLFGIAEWDVDIIKIEDFTIIDFTDYEETPVYDGFQSLSEDFAADYETVSNPTQFVADLRGDREFEHE